MYGVPADLDLTPFVGAAVERVDLGKYNIDFRFDTSESHTISVQGAWELRDPRATIVDRDIDPSARESYQLHMLLGREVVGTEVTAPESFALRFDSGHVLRVFDRSPEYESFSIQPGDVFV